MHSKLEGCGSEQIAEIGDELHPYLLLFLNDIVILTNQLGNEVPAVSLACSAMKIATVKVTSLKPIHPRPLMPHGVLFDH